MRTEAKQRIAFFILALAIFMFMTRIAEAQSMQVNQQSCPNGNFKVTNTTVECVICQAGFTATNGTCVAQPKSLNTQNTENSPIRKFEAFINENAKAISPENPPLGTFIQFVAIIAILVYGFSAFKKMLGGR
ncbi:MAG: hypothetical protein HY376_02945 [Candidatus Blackburnbacteria bacterium]|nr:hypothetical protein [Candidatus Blackburnbacteria bacterium]